MFAIMRSLWRFRMSRIWRLRRCKIILVFVFVLLFANWDHLVKNAENNERMAELPGWERNKSLKIGYYMDPMKNTTLLMPKNFCRSKILVVIAVCSSLEHFSKRQTIRETWGKTKEFNYGTFQKLHSHLDGKYLPIMTARLKLYLIGSGKSLSAKIRIVFIVGRAKQDSLLESEKLYRESNDYNDIIQENFVDSYHNLTIKSVMVLKHISRSCARTSAFLLKCDDDSFVNVPNLIHFLLGGTIPLYKDTVEYHNLANYKVMSPWIRLNSTRGVMYGNKFCNMEANSDASSPWYMPEYMFAGAKYPQYLSGTGYLLSIDVVQRLYEEALTTPLVHLEDVFVTGICAEKAGIQRSHHPLFNYLHGKPLCTLKGIITLHPIPEDKMLQAWNFVSNFNTKCPPPDRHGIKRFITEKSHC